MLYYILGPGGCVIMSKMLPYRLESILKQGPAIENIVEDHNFVSKIWSQTGV